MKFKRILIISGIILFFIAAAAVSFVTYRLVAVDMASRPAVQFLEPVHDQEIPLGDMLVRFIARDREGIEHVELWVDGELYAARKSNLAEGSNPFPFVEQWQPKSEGTHILTARAVNTQNRDTVASVVVQVSKEIVAEEITAELLPDESGAAEPAPESGAAPVPSEEEADDEYVPFVDETIIIPPLEGYISDPERSILDMIPKIRLPGNAIFRGARLLEVEALYLETDRAYDGVFCYLTIEESPIERIPPNDEEYIQADMGNLWDIKSHFSGENKRIVYLDEEDNFLDMTLNCWGVIFEAGAVYELGILNAAVPSSSWDGRLIEQEAIGPSGWFHIGYQVQAPEFDEYALPAPVLSVECSDFFSVVDVCYLRWSYSDEARENIDGFIVQMNGSLLSVEYSRDDNYIVAESWGTYPPCSETYTYQVYAYQEDPVFGILSLASNPVSLTADPCYNWVKVTFSKLHLSCLSGDDNTGGWCTNKVGDVSEDIIDRVYNECSRRSYHDINGCSYGTLWANERRIRIGNENFCFYMADDSCYLVDEIPFVTSNELWIPLGDMESLYIGMNWYDLDTWPNPDDRQCYAEYRFMAEDIEDIAARSNRRQTFYKYFSERGGGRCGLEFTIHAIQETPPSDD